MGTPQIFKGTPTEWQQILVPGKIVKDGATAIVTQDRIEEMAANYDGPIQLDLEHETVSNPKAPAQGWYDSLAPHGPNGEPGLWGHLQSYTAPAMDLVTSGAKRFLSAFFTMKGKSQDGKDIGWKLISVALCSQPFVKGMQPVALSEGDETGYAESVSLADNMALGWEETPNEIRHRVKEPGLFEPETFRRKEITPGVSIIIGKLKNPPEGQSGSMEVQAVRFDKSKFDTQSAKQWMSQHKLTEGANMEEYTKVKAALGLPDTATLDECLATIAKMKEAGVPAPGAQAETDKQLSETVKVLRAEVVALTVDGIIRDGKALPAERETLILACSADPTAFRAQMAARPEMTLTATTEGMPAPTDPKPEEVKIDPKIKEAFEADKMAQAAGLTLSEFAEGYTLALATKEA